MLQRMLWDSFRPPDGPKLSFATGPVNPRARTTYIQRVTDSRSDPCNARFGNAFEEPEATLLQFVRT